MSVSPTVASPPQSQASRAPCDGMGIGIGVAGVAVGVLLEIATAAAGVKQAVRY